MSEMKALTAIREKFRGVILDEFIKNDRRVYVMVTKEDVPRVCRYLYEELGGRFAIATGADTRSGIEILYHFMFPGDHQLITVKTTVKKPSPEIESIATFLPAANWIEREIYDFLGVRFIGHPDPRRILMADDWPEDTYPYRRDFIGVPACARTLGVKKEPEE
jgi:Ni,Fe-hydrogenase III component G